MKKILLLSIILIFLGCDLFPSSVPPIIDPNQPIDPNAQRIVDPNMTDIAEGAVTLTQALGLIWPALIPIGTAAGGILATYKRLKPKIKEAQAGTNKYYAGGETLAIVLEDIKLNEPDLWEKIGPKIADASKVSRDVSDAIKGFRGV